VDEKVAVSVFVANRGALIDYVYAIVGCRSHAEDLVQEAWLRFDQASRRSFFHEPLAYLYRIARNLAFDGRRKAQRERKVFKFSSFDAETELAADEQPSPEATALYKDEVALLMDAIAELPERTRIALEMHRFGGCKLREIATFLQISVPLAHILVADGIEHCKHRLGWP
jgi:RNA polymerase sigma factor (sigma-70 family)